MAQDSDTKSYLNRLGEGLAGDASLKSQVEIDVPEAATEEVASKEQINVDNAVFIVQGGIALEAVEDKIIIMLDPFRTGYECKTCGGSGVLVVCPKCKGHGKDRFDQLCPVCKGEPNKLSGEKCPDCKGVGSLLVIPEIAKSLPTSGRIVSKGPECKKVKIGERYLFGVHVGYFLPFRRNILLRCMREHEILCRIYSLDKHIAMGDYFAVPDETANMDNM